jgi:pyruvate kinase
LLATSLCFDRTRRAELQKYQKRISRKKLKDKPNQSTRRAKIICTIGPACNTEAAMRELLRLGMDIARLNFSHGTHEDHARNIRRLRRAAEREGRTICILQDLQGPKIRTGPLEGHEPVLLKTGSVVTITPQDVLGTATRISTTFPDLARELTPGARILLSDGLIELRVRDVPGKDRGKDVQCDVINGGLLGEHKGINLPGIALSIPALTEKDRKDLEFGLAHGVDAVAISFVRTAADVSMVKQIIAKHSSDVPVIAKLEKPQAIDHLEEILEAADGVMVARGDLGVEMAPEKVPVIQKHVIRRASASRKPVITATQMLESMIENPRPTRAEASDVANAIFDGTDAVMLSAETASGQYPRESVSIMSRIVVEAECNMDDFVQFRRRRRRRRRFAHGRHRRLHRDRQHGSHDFQISPEGPDLRLHAQRARGSAYESLLGSSSRPLPSGPLRRTDGHDGRARPGSPRSAQARGRARSRRRHPPGLRFHQPDAPARGHQRRSRAY